MDGPDDDIDSQELDECLERLNALKAQFKLDESEQDAPIVLRRERIKAKTAAIQQKLGEDRPDAGRVRTPSRKRRGSIGSVVPGGSRRPSSRRPSSRRKSSFVSQAPPSPATRRPTGRTPRRGEPPTRKTKRSKDAKDGSAKMATLDMSVSHLERTNRQAQAVLRRESTFKGEVSGSLVSGQAACIGSLDSNTGRLTPQRRLKRRDGASGFDAEVLRALRKQNAKLHSELADLHRKHFEAVAAQGALQRELVALKVAKKKADANAKSAGESFKAELELERAKSEDWRKRYRDLSKRFKTAQSRQRGAAQKMRDTKPTTYAAIAQARAAVSRRGARAWIPTSAHSVVTLPGGSVTVL